MKPYRRLRRRKWLAALGCAALLPVCLTVGGAGPAGAAATAPQAFPVVGADYL